MFSLLAMLIGGDARLLLLRESILTPLLGFACLLSLPTKRPLMFIFMRRFTAGADPGKPQYFNEGIKRPSLLHVVRVATGVWAAVFC